MRVGKNWFRFFRREVWPRRRAVFLHRNAVLSAVAAVLVGLVVPQLPRGGQFPSATFGDVATATLAFSGLSFGGAIGAVILSIGLPTGRHFDTMVVNAAKASPVQVLNGTAQLRGSGRTVTQNDFAKDFRSTYVDLVFVFQMAAVAQMLLAVASLLVLASIGRGEIRPASSGIGTSLALGTMTLFSTYAVMQLASSLKALSALARQRDSFHRAEVLGRQPKAEQVDQ